MKCIVAAVAIVALAVAAEAGYPYAGYPYAGYGATVIQANAPAWPYAGYPYAHAAAYPAYAHAAYPAAISAYHGAPHAAIYAAPHYGPAASVAHHAGVVPGATSVTATRGAVHVAPLPGHAISQKQLNLAPAPGTL
ncbi:adult cuticle protein 1-like [Anopheles ziemanni]|uniref:adult cuticle protein 1-like n=1 Tax=Anopheles coustani TaxID=139045 RepID=UPI00265A0AAC|nr:adult cuticle protein 1-like [Anopheles coustani]XP_058177475.1 adult cuticle protein 1-like [Anopheles ziemanni]